ncbi:MAG: radical SAM protein [Nitrososphaeria archaeon]|nr:radical SAM protein [Nitrososphaeria archaeon]
MVMEQIAEESKEVKKVVKNTLSICPECNMIISAEIVERDRKIFLEKECPKHGLFIDLYYGDAEMYKKFSKYAHDGKGTGSPNINIIGYSCPANCGLCPGHKSHTALANIVVTNRCDLACWYCFFYAEKAGYVYEPTIDQIREMVKAIRREYPVAGNSIQLTGGEPALRDDLPEIIKVIKEEGVDHIQLNTDGIRLSHDFEFFKKVKEAGVSNLYLSFDGVTPRTNPKNHWEAPKVIENARKLNVGVVLVPTIIKGVNDHELGEIIRFAFKNIDIIRAVNFQPVSLTGRITHKEREKLRITIPDCIIKIEEQTGGEIPRDAWFPVPACTPLTHIIEALLKSPKYELSPHFACGAGTYVFKSRDRLVPITEFIDVDGLIKYLQSKADELEAGKNRIITVAKILWEFKKFIREDKQPEGINVKKMIYEIILKHDYKSVGDWHRRSLFIGMMHFQDKYNYDIERVMRCSIHYPMPDGRIIPFCAFNVIPEWYRDRVQRLYGIPIEEWEKKTGKKITEQYYRRILQVETD